MNAQRRTITMNPEAELSDPMEATKLQLEMLEQRVTRALFALKRGYKHDFDEQLKGIKHHIMRVHHLTYQRGQDGDRRLAHAIREAAYNTDATVSAANDAGAMYIQGDFDINVMAKRMIW